jgi:hypothetical protein
MAVLRSMRKQLRPPERFCTSASGVVRASRIIMSLCWMREIQTFCPLMTQRPSFLTAMVLSWVVSLPVVGSVTPMDWMRSSPEAMRGRYFSFCSVEPLRTMAFITYIWPWQAPELPPLRLISSMITEASAMDRPEPPYSCGISAAIQPALVSASTKASG